MKPRSFMLIAGEASGDTLAAELVGALQKQVLAVDSQPTDDAQPLRTELAPEFFGAGGPRMQGAGVELAFDLTQHSVLGISDVLKSYFKFRRIFKQLLRLAIERQPDVIIGVDYGGFNLRFGKAIKDYVGQHRTKFVPWNPKLVQFVSPQVWASRPGRAFTLAGNCDLLLSIFPFEKDWYARRVPKLRVEFVGNPIVERFAIYDSRLTREPAQTAASAKRQSQILLLPGSRADEVRRHWPVVTGAFEVLRRELPALRAKAIFPDAAFAESARSFGLPAELEVQVGGLTAALAQADVAITKSGTITMECAMSGVPTVVFYKTSWPNYFIAKQIVGVKYIAMPNLLAGEEIYPEFLQQAATSENIAHAALDLLNHSTRREAIQAKLTKIVASLGGPGASQRAAKAIVSLIP